MFNFGVERFENKSAILGQNIVIDMNEWAKLETFFYTSGVSYEKLEKINNRVNHLGIAAQTLRNGKLRRFCYYMKEYYTRKIGDRNINIPKLFLCEIVNQGKTYILNLENRANNQIVYRTNLTVKNGFNRFWISSEEFKFVEGVRNNLYLYPEGNTPQLINIVSLELVTLKPEYVERYFPQSKKKVKCIVWDLDHTIWDGVLGEDGLNGIRIKKDIVLIIKDMDAVGIINSISSKNYEEKAVGALKKFGLYDYFVCPMINWNAKSENIKLIAKTLDIGMDTFVFVDDSFFELNEVKQNCPDIRTCDIRDIHEYIKSDIFNVPVTEDSRKRRESYKEIAVRNKAAWGFKDDITEFLKSCNMVVHIAHPSHFELMRCYELMQRTNQLNISGERLSFEQIDALVHSLDYDCYRIKVDDKFGDYGLVGFAVFDVSKKDRVVLIHFVFSCRAARKKIEQSFFEYMIRVYKNTGFKTLDLICKITEKNQLMRQVLEESGLFEKKNKTDNGFILEHRMDRALMETGIMSIIYE